MVYYVFLDPAVIPFAAQHGEAGLAALAGVLRALGENCCLAEFDDWRVNSGIYHHVAKLDVDPDYAKRLKVLLAHYKKRDRFIEILESPEPALGISDAESAAQQASRSELDALITENVVTPNRQQTAVLPLFAFNGSSFDQARSNRAVHGIALRGGEHSCEEFYRTHLGKALRHAAFFEICDRLLGEKYAGNFKFTVRRLLNLYNQDSASNATTELTFHIGAGARLHHCQTEIPTLCPNLKIALRVYDATTDDRSLPHERYIVTNQFAFDIGRGMDLFDSSTDCNRDVSISFKNPDEVESLIRRATPVA